MDLVQVQASIRQSAQEQAEALHSVNSWFDEIRTKEKSITRASADVKDNEGGSTSVQRRLPESRSVVAENLKLEGNRCLDAGRYKEAAEAYTKALALSPESWPLYANRCQAYLSGKEYRAAIYDATAALRRNTAHVKSWYRRGVARNALGLHTAAERDLAVVVLLDPTNRPALVEKAKAKESIRTSKKQLPGVPVILR